MPERQAEQRNLQLNRLLSRLWSALTNRGYVAIVDIDEQKVAYCEDEPL